MLLKVKCICKQLLLQLHLMIRTTSRTKKIKVQKNKKSKPNHVYFIEIKKL